MKRAVLSVIGKDALGIIANVSGYLSRAGINILDISQTVLKEYFAMIMLVDYSGCKLPVAEISKELDALGQKNALSIKFQNEEIFNAMHKV